MKIAIIEDKQRILPIVKALACATDPSTGHRNQVYILIPLVSGVEKYKYRRYDVVDGGVNHSQMHCEFSDLGDDNVFGDPDYVVTVLSEAGSQHFGVRETVRELRKRNLMATIVVDVEEGNGLNAEDLLQIGKGGPADDTANDRKDAEDSDECVTDDANDPYRLFQLHNGVEISTENFERDRKWGDWLIRMLQDGGYEVDGSVHPMR